MDTEQLMDSINLNNTEQLVDFNTMINTDIDPSTNNEHTTNNMDTEQLKDYRKLSNTEQSDDYNNMINTNKDPSTDDEPPTSDMNTEQSIDSINMINTNEYTSTTDEHITIDKSAEQLADSNNIICTNKDASSDAEHTTFNIPTETLMHSTNMSVISMNKETKQSNSDIATAHSKEQLTMPTHSINDHQEKGCSSFDDLNEPKPTEQSIFDIPNEQPNKNMEPMNMINDHNKQDDQQTLDNSNDFIESNLTSSGKDGQLLNSKSINCKDIHDGTNANLSNVTAFGDHCYRTFILPKLQKLQEKLNTELKDLDLMLTAENKNDYIQVRNTIFYMFSEVKLEVQTTGVKIVHLKDLQSIREVYAKLVEDIEKKFDPILLLVSIIKNILITNHAKKPHLDFMDPSIGINNIINELNREELEIYKDNGNKIREKLKQLDYTKDPKSKNIIKNVETTLSSLEKHILDFKRKADNMKNHHDSLSQLENIISMYRKLRHNTNKNYSLMNNNISQFLGQN